MNPTRIALLLPHTDTTLEWDLQRTFSETCSIHAERLFLEEVSVEAERKMVEEETPRAVRYLKPINPAVAIFGCTSAGALYGVAGERRYTMELSESIGCPVVSAFGSVLSQLQQADIQKLALFTPYTDDVHAKMADGLREAGVTITWEDSLGLLHDTDIGQVSPDDLLDRISKNPPSVRKCDGLFLSCTNLRAVEIAAQLGERLRMPIFTSNLAIINMVKHMIER